MSARADSGDLLERLGELIQARRHADPEQSYVARLYAKGEDAMLKKVGEEATEFVLAAKGGERAQMVYEAADLWFHVLVALGAHGIAPREVLAELARREGVSGLQEFAARSRAGRAPGGESGKP